MARTRVVRAALQTVAAVAVERHKDCRTVVDRLAERYSAVRMGPARRNQQELRNRTLQVAGLSNTDKLVRWCDPVRGNTYHNCTLAAGKGCSIVRPQRPGLVAGRKGCIAVRGGMEERCLRPAGKIQRWG